MFVATVGSVIIFFVFFVCSVMLGHFFYDSMDRLHKLILQLSNPEYHTAIWVLELIIVLSAFLAVAFGYVSLVLLLWDLGSVL